MTDSTQAPKLALKMLRLLTDFLPQILWLMRKLALRQCQCFSDSGGVGRWLHGACISFQVDAEL